MKLLIGFQLYSQDRFLRLVENNVDFFIKMITIGQYCNDD